MDWFKIGKEVHQGCILSPIYLTSMQSASCEMRVWMKLKLESRLLGEISITSDMQMTLPLRQKAKEELKSLLMKVKEESEKVGLKLNIQSMNIMASDHITSWATDGEKVEIVTEVIFLGSKITVDGVCSHEIKTLAPWKSYDTPRQHTKKQ